MLRTLAKIDLRAVCQVFPAKPPGQEVAVLEGIDLRVHAGELVCIVGTSGCGKSTLLNIVAGFLEPSGGTVTIDGAQVRGPHPRRLFIFQESSVFPWLNVSDNIGFGLDPTDRRRGEVVAHYIRKMGLAGFERAFPAELSGGMRQRVELARALAAGPDVLFMDEPFGALDYLTRLRIRSELLEIWQRERQTVLFVTHDVEEAIQLADRVVVLSSRPAHVREVLEVGLPRPRDVDAPRYREIRDRILALMGIDPFGHEREELKERDPSGADDAEVIRTAAAGTTAK